MKFNKIIAASLIAAALASTSEANACGPLRALFCRSRCATVARYNVATTNTCAAGNCAATVVRSNVLAFGAGSACAGGACRLSAGCASGTCRDFLATSTEYLPPATASGCEVATPAPCEPAKTVVEPCAPVETSTPCAPCEPVETSDPVPACAPACATVATCASGGCSLRDAEAARVSAFIAAANAVRARAGVAPLRESALLSRGCLYQVAICRNRGALVHGAGNEILAENSANFETALAQWVNSPAHRALLLSPSFRFAGVGVIRDRGGRSWYAMRFN